MLNAIKTNFICIYTSKVWNSKKICHNMSTHLFLMIKQNRSPQYSPHSPSGGGDSAGGRAGLKSPIQDEATRLKLGLGAQGDYSDLRLSLSGDHLILSQRGGSVDQHLATPRSPGGPLRASSTLPVGYIRGAASPPAAVAQSSPGRPSLAGSGHLWRSNPVSPTSSAGQGSGSATPRSPHPSVSVGAGGRSALRAGGGAGQGSPLRGGRSPPGAGRQSPQVSASQPLLEDVSHLLPNKHSSEEEDELSQRSQDTRVDREDSGDDNRKNDGDEDDDDEEYSDEDFEDVTDVEL